MHILEEITIAKLKSQGLNFEPYVIRPPVVIDEDGNMETEEAEDD